MNRFPRKLPKFIYLKLALASFFILITSLMVYYDWGVKNDLYIPFIMLIAFLPILAAAILYTKRNFKTNKVGSAVAFNTAVSITVLLLKALLSLWLDRSSA